MSIRTVLRARRVLLISAMLGSAAMDASSSPVNLSDELELVPTTTQGEILLTDGNTSRFFQTVNGEPTRKYHGYTQNGVLGLQKFLYSLIDGGNESQLQWVGTEVQPGLWTRTYRSSDSEEFKLKIETQLLNNSILLQRITYQGHQQGSAKLQLLPIIELRSHHDAAVNLDAEEQIRKNCFATTIPGIRAVRQDLARQLFLGAKSQASGAYGNCSPYAGEKIAQKYVKDQERYGLGDGNGLIQATQRMVLDLNGESGVLWVALMMGEEADDLQAKIKDHLDFAPLYWDQNRSYMMAALPLQPENYEPSLGFKGFSFSTADRNLALSLSWADFASSQMLMNFRGPGLIAGIPWFEQYWGRDTAISLPGALIVPGKKPAAKRVIQNMLDFMELDPTSPVYGRIPNRLEPGSILFNTADALPQFLTSTGIFFENFQDKEFLRSINDQIYLAMNAERGRRDSLGLYTHDDQDTWMDGKLGSWVASPRGNRAVEVQALWFVALRKWSQLNRTIGNEARAQELLAWSNELKLAIRQSFLSNETKSNGYFADHLKVNGAPADQIRPNFLLALQHEETKDLIDSQERKAILRRMIDADLFPAHGVRSLAPDQWFFNPYQQSSGFCSEYACNGWMGYHPYHNFGSHVEGDHMDWAYHNGTVWQWLSGAAFAVLDDAGFHDEAIELWKTLQHDIIDGQSPGHLAEIKDGNASGNPYGWDKGAPMQTWSVAEFTNMTVSGYVGYKREFHKKTVRLKPRKALFEKGIKIWDGLQLETDVRNIFLEVTGNSITIKNSSDFDFLLILDSSLLGKWELDYQNKTTKSDDLNDGIYQLSLGSGEHGLKIRFM